MLKSVPSSIWGFYVASRHLDTCWNHFPLSLSYNNSCPDTRKRFNNQVHAQAAKLGLRVRTFRDENGDEKLKVLGFGESREDFDREDLEKMMDHV